VKEDYVPLIVGGLVSLASRSSSDSSSPAPPFRHFSPSGGSPQNMMRTSWKRMETLLDGFSAW